MLEIFSIDPTLVSPQVLNRQLDVLEVVMIKTFDKSVRVLSEVGFVTKANFIRYFLTQHIHQEKIIHGN